MKPKPVIFLFVYIFLCVLILVAATLFGVRRIADAGQLEHDQEVPVYADHPVSQPVAFSHNGANVVVIFLKNIALRNRQPFIFTLSLDGRVVREININGTNIGDGDNVRFQFDPISGSLNQTYLITLSSPMSQYSDAVGVGYSSPHKSIAYQLYFSPQSKTESLTSLFVHMRSLVSPQLFLSWVSIGIIGFFICRKDIIQV